ncbi:MAG: beta-N-acetylhexosaminidase [Lachnospiraceae bacterium]|nr:beta-N-acetylhexosaminidase [Lachnospiraceae bacterium]
MNFSILPQPVEIKEKGGIFKLNYNSKIVLNTACKDNEYRFALMLAGTVESACGIRPSIEKGEEKEDGNIIICLNDEGSCKENEKYEIRIDEKNVVLSAETSAGILYGVQTLRQLFEQCGATVPGMEIEDHPVLKTRGFFHDATRGRVQLLDYYKKLADKAAFYKLNQLQLYVEHTYMFRDFSEVWRDDTPLTAEDILELDAYCKSLLIELVPSLATFGHLDKVLKTKSYASLCELEDSDKERFTFGGRMEHHTLNISDPESWNFVEKMLKEFMPLFSSKKFNLCGDETFDLGKGKSKVLADEVGTHRMYVDFVKKICNFLIENGRQPLFWGDIIVGSPELFKELPEEAICLTWGYAENEHFHNAETMHSVGAKQYLCPGVHGWRHLINRLKPAYENISRMCSYALKYEALGLLNTDWGDYGHISDPAFSTAGLIYGAYGAWCGKLPEREELNKRISLTEYGDKTGTFTGLVSDLGDCEGIAWEHLVQYQEYMTSGRETSLQDRKDFLSRCHINSPAVKNSKIDEITVKLLGLSSDLNERGKRVLYSYLLHSEGQKIFNNIAATIVIKLYGMNPLDFGEKENDVIPAVTDNKVLANKLEKWFKYYKDNWRKTCRESELYRIQDVIFYYADTLRNM